MTWQPTSRYVAKEPGRFALTNSDIPSPIPAPTPKRWEECSITDSGATFAFIGGIRRFVRRVTGKPPLGSVVSEPTKPFPADECRRLEEKPPTPKRYVIVLEETGEVRNPESGEFFIGDNGKPCFADRRFLVLRFPILRVVSREAK